MRSTTLLLCLLSACTDAELSSTSSAVVADNGQNLNGQNLNGQNLNGQNLNGQNLNGPGTGTFTIWTSLDGVKLNGKSLDATLTATVFSGYDGNSQVSGTGFVQAEFSARRGDGSNVRMRIREIVPGANGWRYFVEYRETDNNWYPICEDASGARPAIPLNGIWDHRQGVAGGGAHIADARKFTFACDGIGALGKCVGLGYQPWQSTSLANHHQACVRLLRADFCGDGTPYTQNGNLVNLYDGIGLQHDTEDWVIEAEWDIHGARCFYPLNRSHAGIPCYDARVELACGSPTNFSTGALLMNETPDGGTL